MGEMDVCDATPPPGTELGLRTHMTFAARQDHDLPSLASSFKAFLKTQRRKYSRISFPWRIKPTTVNYKLNGEGWRSVVFEFVDDRVHVFHDGLDDTGVSCYVARWLETVGTAIYVRWYTEAGWSTTGVSHRLHC